MNRAYQCRRCKDIGVRKFSHDCGNDDECNWSIIEFSVIKKDKGIRAEDIMPYICDALDNVPEITRQKFLEACKLVEKNYEFRGD